MVFAAIVGSIPSDWGVGKLWLPRKVVASIGLTGPSMDAELRILKMPSPRIMSAELAAERAAASTGWLRSCIEVDARFCRRASFE